MLNIVILVSVACTVEFNGATSWWLLC